MAIVTGLPASYGRWRKALRMGATAAGDERGEGEGEGEGAALCAVRRRDPGYATGRAARVRVGLIINSHDRTIQRDNGE
jgi:hypothetical protein